MIILRIRSKHFIWIEKEDDEEEEKDSSLKNQMPKIGYEAWSLKSSWGRQSYNLSDCIGIEKKQISLSNSNRK